jgi:hypothetical protein
MSNMEKLMHKVATGAKEFAFNSVAELQKVAENAGLPVTRDEIVSFIKAQQNNEASGNVAGVDGNGTLIFGRDWYYTPPTIEARSIL